MTAPPDGYNFVASHTYKASGTFTITDTGQVTAGACTVSSGVHTFTLVETPTPAPELPVTAVPRGARSQ